MDECIKSFATIDNGGGPNETTATLTAAKNPPEIKPDVEAGAYNAKGTVDSAVAECVAN